MSQLFQNLLTFHILLGVSATSAFGYIWMQLKNPEYKISSIRTLSLLGTLTLFISWFTGGYYYLYWYGTNVRPEILAGAQPWVHKLIMETKEHIFLMMPFIAIVTLLAVFTLKDNFGTDSQIKKSVSSLFAINAVIGVLMIIMGFIITGSH